MRVYLFLIGVVFLLGCCCTSPLCAQQKETMGSITGIVKLKDGMTVEGAVVNINKVNRYNQTNSDGYFHFENLTPGDYVLNISYDGYGAVILTIKVAVNQTTPVVIELLPKQEKVLNEVFIKADLQDLKKKSDYVARLPLTYLENPQVYSVVTKHLMEEQGAVTVVDALKNVPGTGVPMVLAQGRVSMFARGFISYPLLRNGVSGLNYGTIDPVNLERIEAIKGPSATLFGTEYTSFGGLFNRVTKKPYEKFGGEISYYAGSWDYNRITADINQPLDLSGKALFRLNVAGTTTQGFQDGTFTKNFTIAPSLRYKISDRLTLDLDVEYMKETGTSPYRFTPFSKFKGIQRITDLGIDYRRSFMSPQVLMTTELFNIFGKFTYKISDRWISETIVTRAKSATYGYRVQLFGVGQDSLRRQVNKGELAYYNTEIQQNFITNFDINEHVKNKAVIGFDYFNYNQVRNDVQYWSGNVNFRNPGPSYNDFDLDYTNTKMLNEPANSQPVKRYFSQPRNTYSAYISDVLSFYDRLMIMLSLRIENYRNQGVIPHSTKLAKGNFNQTALSPKIGVVYQIMKRKLSLFVNYMNGFSNVNGTDVNNNIFRPQQANQLEGGVKFELDKNRLTGTVSYYDIRVSNIVRTDINNPGFEVQDGKQFSRGVEAEINAQPVKGLNIILGYGYNDSRFINADASVSGLRPTDAGPTKLFNFWASYFFSGSLLKGFGLGIGGNTGNESYAINTQNTKFIIPSYQVYNATVFYNQKAFRIGFKIDNFTNEKYWSYRLTPQMPLRVSANLTLKF